MARKLRYNDEEGGMVKAQLMKIENYAAKLNDMIHPDDEIEGWVQAKLAVVAAYMGDVKHYLDYELKESFGDGGGVGDFKPKYWEVEFTWDGEEEGDGRKVNVMADSVSDAERKVKDKFGPYYKGLRIVEVEEDKEMSWDEYASKSKKERKKFDDLDEMTKTQMEHDEAQLRREQGFADGGVLEELEEYHIENGPYISASELEYYLRDMNAKYKYKDGSDYGIAVLANQLGYTWDEDADQFYKKMAKGGVMSDTAYKRRMKKWGHIPYGKTKGKYTIEYEAEGEKQSEIWDTKEMAVDNAKRYKKIEDFSNIKIKDESGKNVEFADGGETKEPAYVEIAKPTDLKLNKVRRKVEELAEMGYKSADILLKMLFVTDEPKALVNQFQTLKNQVFFQKGIKKFYKGGKMEDLMMRYEGSSFAEDFREAREHLGEEMWKDMTFNERVEATKYLKAQGHIGYYGEEETLETIASMQYAKGGSVPKKTVVDFIKALEDSKIVAKDAHKNPKAVDTINSIVSMSKVEYKEYIKQNPNKNVTMIFDEYQDWIQTYGK